MTPTPSAPDAPHGLSRRSLLSAGALSAAGLLLPTPAHARAVRGKAEAPAKARNVIFMVADGMSTGTLTLAHMVRSRGWAFGGEKQEARPSHWVGLWNKPGARRATATTHAADSLVTDSAAGGAAWGCGVHVPNGSLNIDMAGSQHLPILIRAKQAGKATGVVTTARVTHATPASFYVNCPDREQEDGIALQMLERKIDLALGGGAKHFPPEALKGHPEYAVVRTSKELSASTGGPSDKLLGVFADSHLPYVLDRAASSAVTEKVPTLAEMTRFALARLGKAAEGFVLQVEGGRVDHAAHNNDAASLVAEQLAFDDAVGEVLAFVEGRDDTLVVLTTDHGNANPGLTLYGAAGERALQKLLMARGSFDEVARRAGAAPKGESVGAFRTGVEELLGVPVKPDAREWKTLLALLGKAEKVMPFGPMNGWPSVLGQALANSFGVSFVSPNHTADMVEVTALGPGSAKLAPMIDNIDLHALMVAALALPPGEPVEGMDRVIVPKRQSGSD